MATFSSGTTSTVRTTPWVGLRPLGSGYETLVQDHAVYVGGWLRWWNPLSHTEYWTDDTVLSQVIAQLRRSIQLAKPLTPKGPAQSPLRYRSSPNSNPDPSLPGA